MQGASVAGQLAQTEANPLAAALVSRLAAEHGIRVLIIKGLSLEHHGLRSGYVSADIDVLVEPARFDDTVALLTGIGWRPRPTTVPSQRLPHHSDTLLNPRWPNDIDVHSVFPGLLARPETAFDALWEHRVQADLAGWPCWMPDQASAIVIWALHSLRSTFRQSRHEVELDQLVTGVLPSLSAEELDEVADRAVQVGAHRPLCAIPALAQLLEGRDGEEMDGAYAAWRRMVDQTHSDIPFLKALRGRPLSDWPWLIRWGIWPPREDLKVLDPAMVDTPIGRLRARARRLTGFVGRAFREAWQSVGSRFRAG